jgi:hypothetical protein
MGKELGEGEKQYIPDGVVMKRVGIRTVERVDRRTDIKRTNHFISFCIHPFISYENESDENEILFFFFVFLKNGGG